MGQREISATAMMKNGREAGRCLTTASYKHPNDPVEQYE